MTKKILIVDDDLDTLRLVGLLLQQKGYSIIAADNGNQAMAKAVSEKPDMVLLDIMMPDVSGIQVLKSLRKDDQTAHIPVILFTAKSAIEEKVRGFNAGADDYITKPIHPAELVSRVRSVLSRNKDRSPSISSNGFKKGEGKISSFIGAKGGLGTTTTALNTGLALQQKTNRSCVFVELRPGAGTTGLMLGITPKKTLRDILILDEKAINERVIHEVLFRHASGLHMLLSSHTPSASQFNFSNRQMNRIINMLAFSFDHVVVDLGPGLMPAAANVIEQSANVFVITEPVHTTILQTKALLDELQMKVFGLGTIHLLLAAKSETNNHLTSNSLQTELGHRITASLPAEPAHFNQAISSTTPVLTLQPTSPYSQKIIAISEIISA